MLATVLAATLRGLEGRPVRVEVDVAPGLPGFTIVGLADAALRESRERVRGAASAGLPGVRAGRLWPPTVRAAPWCCGSEARSRDPWRSPPSGRPPGRG